MKLGIPGSSHAAVTPAGAWCMTHEIIRADR
jgi:hypothetical protein